MRPQLQPKKTKVRLNYRLYSSKRRYKRCTLLTKRSALVLKVGVSHGWRDVPFKAQIIFHSINLRVLANLRTGLDLRTGPSHCENTSADWTEPPVLQLPV